MVRDHSEPFAGHRWVRLVSCETDLQVGRSGRFGASGGSHFARGELLGAIRRLRWLPIIGEAPDAVQSTFAFHPFCEVPLQNPADKVPHRL
jgi:hypothetical protein